MDIPKGLVIQRLKDNSPDMAHAFPFGERIMEKGNGTYLNLGRSFSFLSVLVFKPNCGIRGHHVHHQKEEHMYILEGTMKGHYWQEDAPEAITTLQHHAGELLSLSPGLGHGFEALSLTRVIEFSPQAFDPKDVVYRSQLLTSDQVG